MRYEILPCTEEESDLIDEKADEIVGEYASADEDDEEEVFVYKVTDPEGELIGGCILVTDELKTATIFYLWVDEAYRRQGVASVLTNQLARAVFEHGKLPFYAAAWSNVRSVKNALRSGFRPAWVALTAK